MSSEAGSPFDTVAATYDAAFSHTAIGRRKRQIVHDYLSRVVRPGWRVLELNCGTGEDARWLAARGCDVLATDVSREMLRVARNKIGQLPEMSHVEFRSMAIEDLADNHLRNQIGEFDLIFSNFDGLNCLEDLSWLPDAAAGVLRPSGHLVAVLMPPYCLLETLGHLAHGRARLRRRSALELPIGNRQGIRTWFHPVSHLVRTFGSRFTIESIRAVGLFTPPTMMRDFYDRHQTGFQRLESLENALSALPVARTLGDHVLIHAVIDRTPDD